MSLPRQWGLPCRLAKVWEAVRLSGESWRAPALQGPKESQQRWRRVARTLVRPEQLMVSVTRCLPELRALEQRARLKPELAPRGRQAQLTVPVWWHPEQLKVRESLRAPGMGEIRRRMRLRMQPPPEQPSPGLRRQVLASWPQGRSVALARQVPVRPQPRSLPQAWALRPPACPE